jgi:long-chain acyl-CoA synthetase
MLLERLGGRLRLCISGGAALNPQIAHMFIGLGLPICQGYGLTEASPIVSVNLLDKNDPASIGMPLPGIEVRFGENQALLVRGPSVMMGYWKNPEATAKVLSPDGWLDTGDQAKEKDGFLYITGRLKEIIVLGNGEKVPPVDMELAIQLDPLFEQALVIGEGKPYLAALVVLNAAQKARVGALDEKALAGRVAAQLKDFPGYAQIRRVAALDEPWTVDNGLLTSTMKPRRSVILERYKDRVEELYASSRKGTVPA